MGAVRVFTIIFAVVLVLLWLLWMGFSAYYVSVMKTFYDYELYTKEYVAGKVVARALAFTAYYGLSSNTAISVAATSTDTSFVGLVTRLPGFLVTVSTIMLIATALLTHFAMVANKYRVTLGLSIFLLLATVGQFVAVYLLFQNVGVAGNSLDQFSVNSFDFQAIQLLSNNNATLTSVAGFGSSYSCCIQIGTLPFSSCVSYSNITCQTAVVEPLAHTYFDGIIKGTYGFFGLEILVAILAFFVAMIDRHAEQGEKSSPYDGDRFL